MTIANIEFSLTDNSDLIKQATAEQVYEALDRVGTDAEGFVSDLTPVETSRLKNSITHEVGENAVIVGTNVEYAVYVEMNEKASHKPPTQAHFLRDGISRNIDSFKSVIETALKGGE